MHCDFHSGNLLVRSENSENSKSKRNWGRFHIGDLGLCRPIDQNQNQVNETGVYGILPYVSPEVIRGFPYTPAADIYSFGMIMWLLATGRQPFFNRPHDLHLAFDICDNVRPEIYTGIPECYSDLMKKCWDNDPLKRPSTKELCDLFIKWRFYSPEHKAIFEQAEKASKKFLNITNDPKAIYTSRFLNFPTLRKNFSTNNHKIIDVNIKEEDIKEEDEEYETRQLELDISIDELENLKYD
ncbi:18064_t:CDS:2 [Funneliformis geosporum]|nr:18064_t:CDS:2 [Funneliformis geosporum]